MITKKSEVKRKQGLSRRELIVNAGIGSVALAASSRGVYAADAEKVEASDRNAELGEKAHLFAGNADLVIELGKRRLCERKNAEGAP